MALNFGLFRREPDEHAVLFFSDHLFSRHPPECQRKGRLDIGPLSLAQWQHSARSVLDMRDIDMVVYESLGDRLGILTANASMTYIVGLPDLKFGESVAAWIRLRAGEQMTAEEVREYCQGKIAHFKIPSHIRFVDSFPMTVTGKLQKFAIRQAEIDDQGLSAHAAATA